MPLTNYVPSYEMPKPLRGFESINRYWDKVNGCYAAKILPGEYYVTKQDERIVTVLGSCVSACIRDPVAKVGGMNHFMLPLTSGFNENDTGLAARFGNVAMEYLINEILKNGGKKNNLEVKLFGGGKVLINMTDVGEKNIRFVKEFVKMENLKLLSEDLGDIYPRKVHYIPLTGKVFVKKIKSTHNSTIMDREKKYKQELETQPTSGSVDLF